MGNRLGQTEEVVIEGKYVELLWKFPYRWEVTELKRGWCDGKDGQQGPSCGCKTG